MTTAADVLVETLIEWKVDTIFGLPGDGINGVMEALRKRQDAIRFVQTRHEQSAAFMATAYGKWTGRLGVCLATSGPGGTNLLTGLYDAKLDQVPVLAITGIQYHDLIETFTQQDVNLTRVFEDVSIYNTVVSDAAHMENVASLACRTAIARRGASLDSKRHAGKTSRGRTVSGFAAPVGLEGDAGWRIDCGKAQCVMKACGRLIARMREQDVDCDIEADIELDSGIAVPVTSDPGDPAIKDRYLSPRQIGPDAGYKGIPQHDKGLQP